MLLDQQINRLSHLDAQIRVISAVNLACSLPSESARWLGNATLLVAACTVIAASWAANVAPWPARFSSLSYTSRQRRKSVLSLGATIETVCYRRELNRCDARKDPNRSCREKSSQNQSKGHSVIHNSGVMRYIDRKVINIQRLT
jgi:hypothetical protein